LVPFQIQNNIVQIRNTFRSCQRLRPALRICFPGRQVIVSQNRG
jgi:hypothetical protein